MDKKEILNKVSGLNASVFEDLVNMFGLVCEGRLRAEFLEDQDTEGDLKPVLEAFNSLKWRSQSVLNDLAKIQELLGALRVSEGETVRLDDEEGA